MEYKYQVGDEVEIVSRLSYYAGKRVSITGKFVFRDGPAYVTTLGSWLEESLRPVPPLSPFEADLRDYISHEKKELGL